MIPVLVEAFKLLAMEKDSLSHQVSSMKRQLDELTKTSFERANYNLEQNRPNPFSRNSIIRYHAPLEASKVNIVITNQRGVQVKTFENLPTGSGQLQIHAAGLQPAIYIYTLVVDGTPVASKKMVVSI